MITINNLNVIYGSNNSFYGKTLLIECYGVKVLKSFDSYVAMIKDDNVIYGDDAFYSMTTRKHLKEFLMQNGKEYPKNQKVEINQKIIDDFLQSINIEE